MPSGIEIENVKELQIWLDGKFALVTQAQHKAEEDARAVRTRVHDLSNDVARLLGLDLVSKFEQVKEHGIELEKLNREAASRAGAIAALKAAYAIGGAIVGGTATVLFQLIRIFH